MFDNLMRRFDLHQRGYEKTTTAYRPFKLIYNEQHEDRDSARKRENYLESAEGKHFSLASLILIDCRDSSTLPACTQGCIMYIKSQKSVLSDFTCFEVVGRSIPGYYNKRPVFKRAFYLCKIHLMTKRLFRFDFIRTKNIENFQTLALLNQLINQSTSGI